MNLIIIAGLPATGKSTLARRLADAFSLPILEKDDIKEEMFDTLGYTDTTAKRQLDIAGNAILLRCAESVLKSGNSLIIVNNFDSNMSDRVQAMLDRCGCRSLTVFLNGDPDVLWARYVERDARNARHLGHTFIDRYPPREGDPVGRSMTREYFADRFEKHGMADFKLRGERIDLDATHPETIDTAALIARVGDFLKGEKEA